VEKLLTLCQRATANIRSRRSEEHIYQWGDKATTFSIVAGVGSIQYFRDNIYKRLADAFYNFESLLKNRTLWTTGSWLVLEVSRGSNPPNSKVVPFFISAYLAKNVLLKK
jgi:hypothetical protein